MNRSIIRKLLMLTVFGGLAFGSQPLMAAVQCFSQEGTYGNLTVTESGAGCGTQLSFGGISGLWMGDSQITESCQFDVSPAVDGSTVEVRMTAHSVNYPTYAEEAVFSLNGAFVAVTPGDIDNSFPTGGADLLVSTGGAGDPTIGGVSAAAPDDGRGTVRFSGAPAAVSTINVQHNNVAGSPNGTIYQVCADDAGGVVEPATTARFTVTKDFTDDNDSQVEVKLSCTSGIPLEQSFFLSDSQASAPAGFNSVTFVLSNVTDGSTSCTVTETPLANYTPIYDNGSEVSNDSCSFGTVVNGGLYSCDIENVPESAEYTVATNWVLTGAETIGDDLEVTVDVTCDAEILTIDGVNGDGSNTASVLLDDGESAVFEIDTAAGPATCSATQATSQSGVEPIASAECTNAQLAAGGTATCTFTNTVFFEGIPTLGRNGLALLVLMVLGVGLVGIRRFV